MKKMLKLLTALLLCMAMFGCSSSTEPSENVSEEKKVYKVGGVQLLQHEALDAASQGFTDALKDLLGDQVEITIQNASGDYNSSATIANQFVSENVDLIMANATPALQAVSAATATIPVVGVSISHYGTALSIDPWTGKTGTNVTGVSDLAPLDQQADQIVEIFPEARKVLREDRIELGRAIIQIAASHGMTVKPCAEGDFLAPYGADCSGCMTVSMYEQALHQRLKVPRQQPARKGCACYLGGDIGAYNTCAHFCRYCYANYDAQTVRMNLARHDPDSPLLIGHLSPEDQVHDANQESWIDHQLSMF
mgnify:CR=1 FL=1